MSMAKIAVVSDVHLGTRQYGLNERYEDFIRAFEAFGKSASAEGVDAVVIGGDLFDSPKPDARSVLKAMEVVGRLKSSGIKVFGIDGNHDLAGGDWLRVIGVDVLEDFDVSEIGDVRVAGLSYMSGRDLVASIQQMADMGTKSDVLVAHFALAEMNGGGSADTGVRELSPMLDKIGVKAVLMGHVHIPDVRKWNGVMYVNPGSTELKSSNEPKEKFYFVVDTDAWEAHEVPIATRPVETVEVATEDDLIKFSSDMAEEARKVSDGSIQRRPFYNVIADDAVDDAFKRISKAIHDSSAIARIVMRSSRSRDLAPVVDRKESVATLESAIEARFPKESEEARLTSSMLHSPDPSSIHMIVEKFMKGYA